MVNQLESDDCFAGNQLMSDDFKVNQLASDDCFEGLKKYSHVDMVLCLDDTADAMLHIEA
jgi:hypothetical protein